MVYVDSNVFILNFLDTTAKGESVKAFMELVDGGIVEALTSSLTLDEVMWVFIKNGRKNRISEAVESIYESRVRILPVTSQAPLKACSIMDKYGLNPRDAIHVAVMKENRIGEIISEDRAFDRVEGIKRYSIKGFLDKFGKGAP